MNYFTIKFQTLSLASSVAWAVIFFVIWFFSLGKRGKLVTPSLREKNSVVCKRFIKTLPLSPTPALVFALKMCFKHATGLSEVCNSFFSRCRLVKSRRDCKASQSTRNEYVREANDNGVILSVVSVNTTAVVAILRRKRAMNTATELETTLASNVVARK